jgi:hypothetical protein
MKPGLTIEIASVPDRDQLVAEIWAGQDQFAELRHEGGSLVLQVFAPPNGGAWDLAFEQVMSALATAKERLAGEGD